MPDMTNNPERVLPSIEILPRTPLVDERVSIRLIGFAPHTLVTVRAATFDRFGNQYRAYALFQTDHDGMVDAATQQPMAGSYTDTDVMGLFWSGVLTANHRAVPEASVPRDHPAPVYFTAEVGGVTVASTELERLYAAPGVTQRAVREEELAGTFFYPAAPGPHPGLIVVGGSTGGLFPGTAALLASHGYSALALAYFAYEHLPPRLINIPLEYFATAIRWMQRQDTVCRDRLAVIGTSRGGELALLLGATFPDITAVVGYVPSGVMWGGLGQDGSGHRPAAWTYHGQPLPFVLEDYTPAQVAAWKKGGEPYAETPMFLLALQNAAAVAHATIPVERIHGPVLLISGEDDHVWPSTRLSEMVMERLRIHQHPYPYRHLHYPGAGHLIGFPYVVSSVTHGLHPANDRDYAYGGNTKDNAMARSDSWSQLLRFLTESLAP